jgi:hypothetical protein
MASSSLFPALPPALPRAQSTGPDHPQPNPTRARLITDGAMRLF